MSDELQWDADAAAYIRGRGDRYPGAGSVEPEWTQEVISDVDLLAFEPDPKSRMGASRFIGWSPTARRVLVIIAYRDLDGDLHGINAWPATGNDLRTTRKESNMAKKIDQTLAEKLRQESEKTKDDAYPEGARGTRPNRTKVYSVRLSDQEEDQIQKLAESKHLPPSTLVRSWILERLDLEQSSR